jgi:hypothetical protein
MPRHPVVDLLRHHAYFGTEPNAEEIDDLKLGPTDRRLVRKAAETAASLHAEGEQGRAHQYALETSHEIVADLPEAQQDPNYNPAPDPLAGVTDPAELAAAVGLGFTEGPHRA